jgi:hypothetical protein
LLANILGTIANSTKEAEKHRCAQLGGFSP